MFALESKLRLQRGLSLQDGDEASPRTKRFAEAESNKALRKLDWERRWLAAQMKWDFAPDERLDLFTEFGISSDGKERKLQLVRKLWAPDTIRWAGAVTMAMCCYDLAAVKEVASTSLLLRKWLRSTGSQLREQAKQVA